MVEECAVDSPFAVVVVLAIEQEQQGERLGDEELSLEREEPDFEGETQDPEGG